MDLLNYGYREVQIVHLSVYMLLKKIPNLLTQD